MEGSNSRQAETEAEREWYVRTVDYRQHYREAEVGPVHDPADKTALAKFGNTTSDVPHVSGGVWQLSLVWANLREGCKFSGRHSSPSSF